MTTLNDLIKQSQSISNKFFSSEIPIYVNGTPMNIELKENQNSEGKVWVDMTFNRKNV